MLTLISIADLMRKDTIGAKSKRKLKKNIVLPKEAQSGECRVFEK